MTLEVKRLDWESFCLEMSNDLKDWETTIHVLSSSMGAQLLSERLPFHGLILEEIDGREAIRILVGSLSGGEQTHNISMPTKIAFAERGRGPAGTLDIEDAGGTTTLITFIQPRRELFKQPTAEIQAEHMEK